MNDKMIKDYVNTLTENKVTNWDVANGVVCVDGVSFKAAPWRYDRKLKALHYLSVEYKAVEELCSYKAMRVESKNADMYDILYAELDTCEWLLDDELVSVYALANGGKTMSVVMKTKKEILCTIDIATTLNEKSVPVPKHEMVGKRGYIGDRSIHEHVPSQDIYVFQEDKEYPAFHGAPDLPNLELAPEEVIVSESIADILTNPDGVAEALKRHKKILHYVDCVNRSLESGEVIAVEG